MQLNQYRSRNQTLFGSAMVLSAAAGFGTLAIFGKLAAEVGMPISTLLFFRFLVATAILWSVLPLVNNYILPSGKEFWFALGIGLIYGVMTLLFFWGLTFITAGLAAIVFYTYPVHVFVISATLLDEPVTRTKFVALTFGIVGMLVILGGNTEAINPIGVGLVLLAALCYAIYSTGSRAALQQVDTGTFTATAMIATLVSMLPYWISSGNLAFPISGYGWSLIVGIGTIGTAVPIVLYVGGLNRIEATHASVIGTSEPVLTVLLGLVLLGEAVTLRVFVGGFIVLVGVLIIQFDSRPSGMVAH